MSKLDTSLQAVIDAIPTLAWCSRPDGFVDLFNAPWQNYTGISWRDLCGWGWKGAVHPEDINSLVDKWLAVLASGEAGEAEARLRRFDGEFRWSLFRFSPWRDETGKILRWFGTSTDLENRKQAEDVLRASEQSFRRIVDRIPGFVFTTTASGEIEFVNQQFLNYSGRSLEELKKWEVGDLVHPEDVSKVIAARTRSIETGNPEEVAHRVRRADGVYRWFHTRRLPERDTHGRIIRWYLLLTDIDERKKADERLVRSERDLLEAQRLTHTGNWRYDFASKKVTTSAEVDRIHGIQPHEDGANREIYFSRVDPSDRERIRELFWGKLIIGKTDYEADYPITLPDGTVKHIHVVAHPVLDDSGNLVEIIGTTMDVTEQWHARAKLEQAFEEIKRLKDRLHDENLALREQIDQAFMFEEIVGSSAALKGVLSNVVKVAPTDSTVLITGETGSGKELIARAIHKRSRRSGQAFISVNCAAIPASLIASELFGHEKGAFTGALQRRQGRFELAHSGTIFLDEVGDLPADAQVALLRVLQEREFERVGGSRAIPTDVRVIAATNRDLVRAMADGSFRADLFYRLNVFPIHMPPLRERVADIPLLVEYFVKRYAEKLVKRVSRIDKKTIELCQAYAWPGNIRELQNIIERSVILCTGETFEIDAGWLSARLPRPERSAAMTMTLQSQEKEIIEAALAESKGKIAGPDGAAAKIGIPRSTLDSKIKQLKIKKSKFKPD